MSPVFADISQPYGPLIETLVRVMSWNVWCHFGPWEQRYNAIEAEIRRLQPDIAVLQESWHTQEHDPIADIGQRLRMHLARAEAWYEPFGLESGAAVLSRRPLGHTGHVRAEGVDGGPGALFQHVRVAGPRGDLDVFAVMLDWRPHRSDIRQQQVRELAEFVHERNRDGGPAVICGDFNAAPDSDEIRSMTGRAAAPAPGFFVYDAWEMAGGGGGGHTWSNENAWALSALLPSRRIDYILSAWPRANGAGHPVSCQRVGVQTETPPSDHYGLIAELRY